MQELYEGAAPSEVRETPGGLGRSGGGDNKKSGAAGQSQNFEALAHAEEDSDQRLRGEGLLITSNSYSLLAVSHVLRIDTALRPTACQETPRSHRNVTGP